MSQSLVIVESPGKIRTINRYLGNDYVVKSSVGHVRDLPKTASKKSTNPAPRKSSRKLTPAQRARQREKQKRVAQIRRMGVDPDRDWKASYEILPDKAKVVKELQTLADKSDHIYLATDLDREGEAIAWHLREVIGGEDERFSRVTFNEITKTAIENAFAAPGKINIDRVNAQQARRFLDRVVGFELTPLLYQKVARGLSAGRVQSVAVKLIVEREREIRAFRPEEYWDCFVELTKQERTEAVRFQVSRIESKAFRPGNESEASAALQTLSQAEFQVSEYGVRPTSVKPPPPFITTTMQQAASTRLGYPVARTMRLAQRLYELGLITYTRTDSTNISEEASASVRAHIQSTYGERYLPERPVAYESKGSAQEAHEAIRPTALGSNEAQLGKLDADARRLYDLIWRRFIACQMTSAEYQNTAVTVAAAAFELRATGRVLLFDGYTKVDPPASRREDPPLLPEYAVGEQLYYQESEKSQHFTKPPPRFSEARLIRELENRGIGRPSTYANIISTIQARGYVTLQSKRFYAERIGELVTDRLAKSFANLMNYDFTAQMEEQLDEVALGKRNWKTVLNGFYDDFSEKLKIASDAVRGMPRNTPVPTDISCRECGRKMQVRVGSTGVFLGCEGYTLPPKERCTYTSNLITEADVEATTDDEEEQESLLLLTKRDCPKCHTLMDGFLLDPAHKLHLCGNTPDCQGFEIENGEFRIKGYDGPVISCDKCEAEMQLKSGRFGKYFGCTNLECKNTRKLLPNGQPAPPVADPISMPELLCEGIDDHFVLREGRRGLFLAASKYPRHRVTKQPLVQDLKNHANELDPKFHYFLDAPIDDGQGHPATIRFARKTEEHYLSTSTKDDKDTGWRAFYQNRQWVESQAKKRTPPRRNTKPRRKSS